MGDHSIEDQINQAIRDEVLPAVKSAVSEQLLQSVEQLRNVKVIPDQKLDARNRAIRTFLANLGLDVAITLLSVLATAILTLDITSKEAWTTLGILLLKTALSAPASYIARLKFGPKQAVPLTLTEGT